MKQTNTTKGAPRAPENPAGAVPIAAAAEPMEDLAERASASPIEDSEGAGGHD
jgi:hypothetical protein